MGYSEIQDICDSERKKIPPSNRSQSTIKERSRVLSKDTSSSNLNSKAVQRISNENARHDLQNQSSLVSFVEFDNQKSMMTSMADYHKRSENIADYDHTGLSVEQDLYLPRASINRPQALQNRSLNQISQDISDYSYKLQSNIQLQPALRSSTKLPKDQARYRNITEFDELNVSCFDSIMDTEYNPIVRDDLNDQNKRSSKNSRIRTEVSSKLSMNPEDIRRSLNNNRLSLDNNPRLQGRLRELTGAVDASRVNSSLIVESSYQGKPRSKGTTAAERRSFEKGIYDVMNGLFNIRNKIEKQQENLLTAKNESLLHIHSRTRSFSNMGLQTEGNVNVQNEPVYVVAQTKAIPVATNMYGDLDMSRRVSLGGHRNERVVVRDQAYMMANSSFDGSRKATESGIRGVQSDFKARNPIYLHEKERSDKIHYRNRHRNSLA